MHVTTTSLMTTSGLMKSSTDKSEMASNSRGSLHTNRHSGRSPPFILIGLLVVIAILSFNYWSASSSNRELEDNLKSSQAKYAEIFAKYNTQGDEFKSVKRENDGHRSRVEQLESDLSLKAKDHEDIKKRLDQSSNDIAKLRDEYDSLQAQIQQQMNTHDEEMEECEQDVEKRETQLRDKDNAIAVCQQEKSELEQAKQTLQAQITDLQSQFSKKTCEGEVSSYRISLLNKLQDLGGPDVLLGLQKVGVDISGVQLNSNWQPPQGVKQDPGASNQQSADAVENQEPGNQGNAQPVDGNQQPEQQPEKADQAAVQQNDAAGQQPEVLPAGETENEQPQEGNQPPIVNEQIMPPGGEAVDAQNGEPAQNVAEGDNQAQEPQANNAEGNVTSTEQEVDINQDQENKDKDKNETDSVTPSPASAPSTPENIKDNANQPDFENGLENGDNQTIMNVTNEQPRESQLQAQAPAETPENAPAESPVETPVQPLEQNDAPDANRYQEAVNRQSFNPYKVKEDLKIQLGIQNQDGDQVARAQPVDQSQGGLDTAVAQQGLAPQMDGNPGYQQVPPGRFEAAPVGDQPAQDQPANNEEQVDQPPRDVVQQGEQRFQPQPDMVQQGEERFQPQADQQIQPVDQQVQPVVNQQIEPLHHQDQQRLGDRIPPAVIDQPMLGGEQGINAPAPAAVPNDGDAQEIGAAAYDEEEEGDDFGRDDLQRAREQDIQDADGDVEERPNELDDQQFDTEVHDNGLLDDDPMNRGMRDYDPNGQAGNLEDVKFDDAADENLEDEGNFADDNDLVGQDDLEDDDADGGNLDDGDDAADDYDDNAADDDAAYDDEDDDDDDQYDDVENDGVDAAGDDYAGDNDGDNAMDNAADNEEDAAIDDDEEDDNALRFQGGGNLQ